MSNTKKYILVLLLITLPVLLWVAITFVVNFLYLSIGGKNPDVLGIMFAAAFITGCVTIPSLALIFNDENPFK